MAGYGLELDNYELCNLEQLLHISVLICTTRKPIAYRLMRNK
jgi:hypothetical protein